MMVVVNGRNDRYYVCVCVCVCVCVYSYLKMSNLIKKIYTFCVPKFYDNICTCMHTIYIYIYISIYVRNVYIYIYM